MYPRKIKVKLIILLVINPEIAKPIPTNPATIVLGNLMFIITVLSVILTFSCPVKIFKKLKIFIRGTRTILAKIKGLLYNNTVWNK